MRINSWCHRLHYVCLLRWAILMQHCARIDHNLPLLRGFTLNLLLGQAFVASFNQVQ